MLIRVAKTLSYAYVKHTFHPENRVRCKDTFNVIVYLSIIRGRVNLIVMSFRRQS